MCWNKIVHHYDPQWITLTPILTFWVRIIFLCHTYCNVVFFHLKLKMFKSVNNKKKYMKKQLCYI